MPGRTQRLTTEPTRLNPVTRAHVWRSPGDREGEVIVVTHLGVYAIVCAHAAAALPNETGGFLLGRVVCDQQAHCWMVEVNEAIPADSVSQTPVHFSFDWRQVDHVRARREAQGSALVGWYHTHPDMPLFLSETDLDKTHRLLFSEPFQVALIYDPIRGRAAYFHWEAPQVIDPSQAAWREFDLAEEEPEEAPPELAADAAEGATAGRAVGDASADTLEGAFHQAAQSGVSAVHVPRPTPDPPGPIAGKARLDADPPPGAVIDRPSPGEPADAFARDATAQTWPPVMVGAVQTGQAPAASRAPRLRALPFLFGFLSALILLAIAALGYWSVTSR